MTAKHGHSHSHVHDEVKITEEPQFAPGTRIRITQAVLEKYKRRPEYAEGAEGVIKHIHGAYIPPTAEDRSEAEYLYSVQFRPQEIWDADHPEQNGTLHIDVWEDAIEDYETI